MTKPSARKFFGIAFFVIAAIIVFPAVTMFLWNWLIPTIFSGPSISYLQALGLLILSKILFSSGHGKSHRSHSSHHNLHWKKNLRERMDHRCEGSKEDSVTSEASDTTNI